MLKSRQLHLQEEILLLSLNDEKGTVHFGASYDHAAAGALLAELLLTGRVGVEGEKGKARIVIRSSEPVGEPLLDECLRMIKETKKPKKPTEWVAKFAHIKRLKARVAENLVKEGVLKEEQDRFMLVFSRTVFPEADARPEQEIVRRIRRAVVGSGGSIDPRTAVLIALSKHTGLLSRAVDKEILKANKKRVQALVKGELVGDATKEALEAMRAAVMVAVFVPTVITSTH